MSNFTIDFFELAVLAEACMPPNPIARTMFWQHLTDVYWEQMSDEERDKLFDWLNRNDYYKQSLENEEETQIFHARFDLDNQYMVYTTMNGKDDVNRAFKYKDLYYVKRNSWITPEFITKVEKI
jgi:hypothetical protein